MLTAHPHLYLLHNLGHLTHAVRHMQRTMPHMDGQQMLDLATNPHVLAALASGSRPPAVQPAPPQRGSGGAAAGAAGAQQPAR